MRVLDLFSGIGGFSLGLERAGMRTVAFCEIEPYCRAVLAKHWPHVPCYTDIRELTAARLAADGIGVDLICGGFPCQDISFAGKGAGLAGERSGLWREYARLIGELRPQYVIVENVAALLSRGLGAVLGDLAALGYDAEWHCIPASYVGAHHRRDRVWVTAHCDRDRDREPACTFDDEAQGMSADAANADGHEYQGGSSENQWQATAQLSVADAERKRRCGREAERENAANAWKSSRHSQSWCWDTEPDVGRVAHGVPKRVDRLKSLGNSVVPQVVELLGRAIMRAHEAA